MILESIERTSKTKNENNNTQKEEGVEQFDCSLKMKSNKDSWLETKNTFTLKSLSFKRVITLIAFLGLFILTIREVVICVTRFVEKPKFTSIQLLNQNDVNFPSLTFCPVANTGYKEEILQVIH